MPETITSLIEKLEGAEVSAIQRLDPNDVSAADYVPFKGRDLGLFQVAPGWKRLELSRLGLLVRAATRPTGEDSPANEGEA